MKPEKIKTINSFSEYLMTGILVLGPTVVTLWVLWKSFKILDGLLGSVINYVLRDLIGLTFFHSRQIPGLGLFLLLFLLIITGIFAQQVLGKWFLTTARDLMLKIPLANWVYKGVEQVSAAVFSGSNSEVFKKTVLVQFPREGIWSVGIVTSETAGKLSKYLPEDTFIVLVSTTPNPTTGFMLLVQRKDVIEVDLSVEDAIKMIISAGAINGSETKVFQQP